MAAKVKFKCVCGQVLAADASIMGKRVKCPSCAKVVLIPKPPEPKPSEDDLEVLPLIDSNFPPKQSSSTPQKQKTGSSTTNHPIPRRNPAPLPSAAPNTPRTTPQPSKSPSSAAKPSPSPAAPAAKAKSIWDEVDEDDYQLQAAATPTCPKCGAKMSSQDILCIACGYNTQTRAATPTLAPRPSKKKSSAFGWLNRGNREPREQSELGFRLIIGLIVLGVMAFIWGFNERRLADTSSKEPETMSLAKLIERGPDGNANIILTGFQTCNNGVVEGKKVGSEVREPWSAVWVPIVPLEADGNSESMTAQNPQAIIYSTHVKYERETGKLDVPQLRGMVTNRITSLKSDEKKLLQESYPGINFDRCIIFHEGREPQSSELILLAMVFGGIMSVAGGLLLLRSIF